MPTGERQPTRVSQRWKCVLLQYLALPYLYHKMSGSLPAKGNRYFQRPILELHQKKIKVDVDVERQRNGEWQEQSQSSNQPQN